MMSKDKIKYGGKPILLNLPLFLRFWVNGNAMFYDIFIEKKLEWQIN